MKKLILTLCVVIIMCGVAHSLYNSANDYGLATISLPPAVAAQGDDTNGGDNTNGGGNTNGGDNTNGEKIECDGYNVLCQSYLHREVKYVEKKANEEGYFKVLGIEFKGYKSNTYYTVMIEDYSCRIHTNEKNICKRSEERTEVSRHPDEGRCTNGDSTNGGSTN